LRWRCARSVFPPANRRPRRATRLRSSPNCRACSNAPVLAKAGAITGLFTVLVEGDDLNEPISDAVRGILDGHIVLDRQIADRGRYPAVNILKSVSRMLPDCNAEDENRVVLKGRAMLAAYNEMEDLIRIGAYRRGADPKIDEAVRLTPGMEAFLTQGIHERANLPESYAGLAQSAGLQVPEAPAAAARQQAERCRAIGTSTNSPNRNSHRRR